MEQIFCSFCYARNNRVESIFEERWAALLQEYPDTTSYLQRYLYPCREAWLEYTIERLLAKESKFIKLNETIGKLPVSQDEDYHNHYFKEVDISYQYFLTLAILKLQRHEMNHSMHYQYHLSNLEYELKQQVTVESPRG
ncbi:1372_t:CDS:2, partial [Funneliformis caledonium]